MQAIVSCYTRQILSIGVNFVKICEGWFLPIFFHFFADESTSKIFGFGVPPHPYEGFNDFSPWNLLSALSDVISVASEDIRLFGSVYTSVLARKSQTVTILPKWGVFGVNDPQ